jgi:DNA/RNA-binding domain of Phe-tRNA-synthetase-like protein
MSDLQAVPGYWIDPQAAAHGIEVRVRLVLGCTIKRKHEGLERVKRQRLKSVRHDSADARLSGYRELFHELEIQGGAVASPAALHALVEERGLPQISTAVDAYNLVSLERNIVLSAHDLGRLSGPVRLVMSHGNEDFHPLGGAVEHVRPGEWCIRDDRHLLCRMNCKQSELSKVTFDTRNLLLYAQGSRATTTASLEEALDEAAQLIIQFCGGELRELPLLSGQEVLG